MQTEWFKQICMGLNDIFSNDGRGAMGEGGNRDVAPLKGFKKGKIRKYKVFCIIFMQQSY